ncbi:MAG: phosphate ABC transporter substrate-binding protein [Sedimentisphaerales bacterium]|nr:phosphate ABC transporter substrate-binding protein [Sedimentisphaerales bacterium]
MKNMICAMLMILLAAVGSVSAQQLIIDGSTTVGPICDGFAEVFGQIYPDISITVSKTGSGNGAAALVEGRCDIAMMSRFMKSQEFRAALENDVFPVAHVVAMDGVCVILHPSNPINALTSDQIKQIYLGNITNWNQLGGADMEIVAISRDTSSGTFETFHGLIMGGDDLAGSVETVGSNPQAHARVRGTAGAIAYVGLGFLDSEVKAIAVNGVMPSRDTIASGTYPVSRPLYLFTNGYPALGSPAHAFCTFYLTEQGQDIIEDQGFVPVTDY